MFIKVIKYCFILLFFGFLVACAANPFFHKNILRGQIVGLNEDEIVICVGSEDGAEQGQALSVYRVVYKQASPEGYGEFSRKYIGEISIVSIIGEHFARASVVSGNISKHDIVELKE